MTQPATIYALQYAHSAEWRRLWMLPPEHGHMAEPIAHGILEKISPYCVWVRCGLPQPSPLTLKRHSFERRMKGQVLLDTGLQKRPKKMEIMISSKHLAYIHRRFEIHGGGTSAEFMKHLAAHLEAANSLHKAHFLRQSRIEEDDND